jgi:hypothetical protein
VSIPGGQGTGEESCEAKPLQPLRVIQRGAGLRGDLSPSVAKTVMGSRFGGLARNGGGPMMSKANEILKAWVD